MTTSESARLARGRPMPPGFVPELSVEGTTRDAGRQLGAAWRETLELSASQLQNGSKPWWKHRPYAKLIDRYAPHLPDLYLGLAKGANLKENLISTRAPVEVGGCTSFAITPGATIDGRPLSGQTKDVSSSRAMQFVVLRLKLTDGAASALTLTYQGQLFGYGFVSGGCAVFRNSLYTGDTGGTMPYEVWGLLALHCPIVEDVEKLTRDHKVQGSFHCTVADEQGDVIGIEYGPGGPVFLKPKRGIYVHANAVFTNKRLMRHEKDDRFFRRADSVDRVKHLRSALEHNLGRLTPQLACAALMNHEDYPVGVCRHQAVEAMTGGAVIAEPALGFLHVIRGPVCQNWPRTHYL